jgi:hypothetical protein
MRTSHRLCQLSRWHPDMPVNASPIYASQRASIHVTWGLTPLLSFLHSASSIKNGLTILIPYRTRMWFIWVRIRPGLCRGALSISLATIYCALCSLTTSFSVLKACTLPGGGSLPQPRQRHQSWTRGQRAPFLLALKIIKHPCPLCISAEISNCDDPGRSCNDSPSQALPLHFSLYLDVLCVLFKNDLAKAIYLGTCLLA